MKNKSIPGICLVGLGPHSKRIYYKFIEHEVGLGNLSFEILIDLQSKNRDINEFYKTQKILPKLTLLINNKEQIIPHEIDQDTENILLKEINNGRIKFAIISTEPKAHKIYIEFFIKHHIPVLTDKPLTAPVGLNFKITSADSIFTDAKKLYFLSKKYDTPIYIQAQRREHPAYIFVFNEITKIVKEYGIPITFFDVYHSDGVWTMPNEFTLRENHPHKYGYGKLMHSGYHFVDIVSRIAEINKLVVPNLNIYNNTNFLSPKMHFNQINGKSLYYKLFHKRTKPPSDVGMGEVDSYTSFIFKNGNKISSDIVTYGNLNLLQSGFSKRAWFDLPKDTYKGNGRVRQERININVGPLFSIHLHSYQSQEINRGYKYGVGGEHHIDVYIFRNNDLVGGKSMEIIDFSQKKDKLSDFNFLGHNEISRYNVFSKFINNIKSGVLIENQLNTNKILSSMIKSSIKKDTDVIKI